MRSLFVAVMIVVVAAGSFTLGNRFEPLFGAALPPQNPADEVAQDIIAEARTAVARPEYPAPPAGREVTTNEVVEKAVVVPRVEMHSQSVAGFLRIKFPVAVTETRNVQEIVPVRRLIEATPEEIADWNGKVAALEKDYQASLAAEIDRLQNERNSRLAASYGETGFWMKDILLPLIAALGGLIGAIGGLISLRRAQASPTPPPMPATIPLHGDTKR